MKKKRRKVVEKMSSEEQTGGGRGQLVTETRKEGKKKYNSRGKMVEENGNEKCEIQRQNNKG